MTEESGHDDVRRAKLDRLIELVNALPESEDGAELAEIGPLLVDLSDQWASGDLEQIALLNDIGLEFLQAYSGLGAPVLVDFAVQAALGSVARAPEPEDRGTMALCASNLANALWHRVEIAGDNDDLAVALNAARASVEYTDDDHPYRAQHFHVLGNVLRTIFDRNREMSFLDEAITAYRSAIDAATPEDPLWAMAQTTLGASLRQRFVLTLDRAVLDEALRAARSAVATQSLDGAPRALALNNLGVTLMSLRTVSRDAAALDEIVEVFRETVSIQSPNVTVSAMAQSNFGLALALQGERDNRRDIVDSAITAAKVALDLTPATHPGRPRLHYNLGLAFHMKFELSRDRDALRQSANCLRDALETIPAYSPDRAEYLHRRAQALTELFPFRRDWAELDLAIAMHREAVDLTVPEAPAFHSRISELGVALFHRGTLDDVVEAEFCNRRALDTLPDQEGRDRSRYESNLGIALRKRYHLTGNPEALREALEACRAAVDGAEPGDRGAPDRLASLVNTLMQSYEATGDAATLDEALRISRQAADQTPPGHPARPTVLSASCMVLRQMFMCTSEPTLLDEALAAGRAAFAEGRQEANATEPTLALAVTLHYAFEANGEFALLEEAIGLYQVLVRDESLSPGDQGAIRSSLSGALRLRFEATGDLSAIRESTALSREAVELIEPHSSRRGLVLLNFGAALMRTCETSGGAGVLGETLEIARASVAANPEGSALHGAALTNLGTLLRMGYEQAADSAMLDEAVLLGRRALEALPVGHRMRVTSLQQLAQSLVLTCDLYGNVEILREAERRLRELTAATVQHPGNLMARSTLGGVLRHLADRTGDEQLLDEALRYCRDAADPSHEPRIRGQLLLNLGGTLISLFSITGEHAVIDEAIGLLRDSVALASESGPLIRAPRLLDLSRALQMSYTKVGGIGALEEAVEVAREAVRAVPATYFQRGIYLAALAAMLDFLADATKNVKMMEESVRIHRQALALLPAKGVTRARSLGNLGLSLRQLAELSKSPEPLAESADFLRSALGQFAADDPTRLRYQLILGRTAVELTRADGDEEASAEARSLFSAVAHSETAPILFRIAAIGSLGELDMISRAPKAALRSMEQVAELLPRYASRGWSRSDREARLGQLSGLAAETAAIAVAAGMPERAVELLEQTRGLLLGEAIDDRGDVAQLHAVTPDLARELAALRERSAQLEQAEPPIGAPTEMEQRHTQRAPRLGAQRRALAERWTSLLDRIRAVPGCQDFLRPPGIERLLRQADRGPIVMFYAGESGSGALVLRADPEYRVQVVELPGLTEMTAEEQLTKLRAALESTRAGLLARRAAERDLHEVLEWLWSTVAEPVLASLGWADESNPAQNPADDRTRRIWWCPVGALALLPIHAAGRYRQQVRRSALDLVVSSYTPTIRSLEYARGRTAAPATSALLVSMPTTPGAHALDGAAQEARDVARRMPEPSLLSGSAATHRAVAGALTRHPVVHFACHALSDPGVPATSRLLLHDHLDAPLTVSALLRLDLARAELAYLSACSTAETNPALTDEAVHLTAAVHIAGYRHVIGTLWPVDDGAAAQVATDFYERLAGGSTGALDTGRSAWALAEAARRLSRECPLTPSRWAAHLHQGV